MSRGLRIRVEKLEQNIQSKARLFVMREDASKDPIDEQIAAYEAPHDVTARDLLVIRRRELRNPSGAA